MKNILLLVFVFISSCNSNNQAKSEIISEVDTTPKYSDSLIRSEQDKIIGEINFGISEKNAKALIEEFQFNSRKQKVISRVTLDEYFIGNFEFITIYDYYENKKLYKLQIIGAPLSKYQEITNEINSISEVLINKFGQPDTRYPIPEIFQMQTDHRYPINSWEIGRKTIEVQVWDTGSSYITLLSIYQPDIENEIKRKTIAEKDSISKSVKDLF